MLIPPNIDTYNEVKRAFSAKLLCDLCGEIGLKDSERRKFAKFLITVTARYLELKRVNPKVLTPSEQSREVFDKLRDALYEAKTVHEKMLNDTPSTAKFYTALRNLYPNLDDTTKLMLNPYMDKAGYTAGLLNKFFDLLCTTCDEAKSISFGKEKSDKSSNYLAWWAGEIRRHWPKNHAIGFGLADWLKEESAYKSRSCEILYHLISKIDKKVTPENVETAVKKVIKIHINEDPAKLIWE